MNKPTYFRIALPLVAIALGLQVVGCYCIAACASSAGLFVTMNLSLPFFQNTLNRELDRTLSEMSLYRGFVWVGLALAILSLVCVIVSICRREISRRLIPGILLGAYAASWVFLAGTSNL